jgi:hypothetical protein
MTGRSNMDGLGDNAGEWVGADPILLTIVKSAQPGTNQPPLGLGMKPEPLDSASWSSQ